MQKLRQSLALFGALTFLNQKEPLAELKSTFCSFSKTSVSSVRLSNVC